MNVYQMTYGDPPPSLAAMDVHIWLLPLVQSLAEQATLSPEEQERATRFRFEHDRLRWISARAMLRTLLGWYTGKAASTVCLGYTKYGKPFLLAHPTLCFNLSHAGDYGLLAVAHGRAIGVDIECIRPDFADPAVSHHFFSSAEQAALVGCPPADFPIAFFTCWVCKESYIKARGEGLSHPLKDFDVAVQPDATDLLIATRPDAHERDDWYMQMVRVPTGYLAALTVGCYSSAKAGAKCNPMTETR